MFCRGYSTGLHRTHNTAKNNGFTGRLSTVVNLQLCLFYCKVSDRKITPVPREQRVIIDLQIFMAYFNEKCHYNRVDASFYIEFCRILCHNNIQRYQALLRLATSIKMKALPNGRAFLFVF